MNRAKTLTGKFQIRNSGVSLLSHEASKAVNKFQIRNLGVSLL